MNTELLSFAKPAKDLSRNPLGIIALFIVLVYGFACLLFGFSAVNLNATERELMIWFVVLFPLVVLFLFGWLVSQHHDKLYAPTDYRDDASFLKTIGQKAIETNESSKYVKDLLEYGGDFAIISDQEELIEADMDNRGLPQDGQTTKILIRQLAATQVISWFEKTYYTIFGSQIALLKLALAEGGISKDDAIEIFTKTKDMNPEAFETWNLEQYLIYLFNSQLIEETDNRLKTTIRGGEFIKILASSGYSEDKNF